MSNELTEDLLLDIEQAVADGATTDKEIADGIGWNVSTFGDWKNGQRKNGAVESAKIREAIQSGKSRQRKKFLQVGEYSLLKRIKGYEYEEVTIEDGETDKGSFNKTKTVKKQMAPDTTSIIFALVNSGKWRPINRDIIINNNAKEKHVIGWEYSSSDKEDKKEVEA